MNKQYHPFKEWLIKKLVFAWLHMITFGVTAGSPIENTATFLLFDRYRHRSEMVGSLYNQLSNDRGLCAKWHYHRDYDDYKIIGGSLVILDIGKYRRV